MDLNSNFIDCVSKYSRHKISWKSVQRESNFPMRRERETDGPTAKLMTNIRNFANAPKICVEFRLVNHWCMFGWPQQHNAMDINHQPTDHLTQFFILPCCVIHFMCMGYRCRAREGVRWTERAPTRQSAVYRSHQNSRDWAVPYSYGHLTPTRTPLSVTSVTFCWHRY
jgi:hypothetical protein